LAADRKPTAYGKTSSSCGDRRDPSAGYVTKLVPADTETWVLVEGYVPALVSPETWEAAQVPKSSPKKGDRRTDTPSRYSLRGLIQCHVCGA
jgi:hypothetical protein